MIKLWQLIDETDSYLYYVGNNGTVIRKHKRTNKVKECCTFMQDKKCGSNLKYAKVNRKQLNLATLVYKSFCRSDFDSNKYYITYKDGNRENCAFDNLIPVSRKHIPSLTKATDKRCRKVVVQEYKKDPVIYPSVRSAAKDLYCSYQTLMDYLNGVRKTSVLKKWGRKIYYLEERE